MVIWTQIGCALGGFAPAVAAALQGTGRAGGFPVAVLTFAACLIRAIAVFTARETYRTKIYDLGRAIGGG